MNADGGLVWCEGADCADITAVWCGVKVLIVLT
jgi:hypothetical protein